MISILRWAGNSNWVAPSWTLLIIVLLCLPGNSIPGDGIFGIPHLDKIIHFFLFALQMIFWGIWWWRRGKPERPWTRTLRNLLWAILLFGVGMEFVQRYFVPNRSFDVWDILADSVGALVGYWFLRKKGKEYKLLI